MDRPHQSSPLSMERGQMKETTAEVGPCSQHAAEPISAHYIRTGLYMFGSTYKFNHPSNKMLVVASARVEGGYPESSSSQPPCQLNGGHRDINERMLHSAMILFGEFERLERFWSGSCSFEEFRSIDEANERLQGCVFGESRIQIMFPSSELYGLGKDTAPILPGYRGSIYGPPTYIKDVMVLFLFSPRATLLVSPSDFLTKALKMSGPERLYGDVIKFVPIHPFEVKPHPQKLVSYLVSLKRALATFLINGLCNIWFGGPLALGDLKINK